jgi:hypothetical protein
VCGAWLNNPWPRRARWNKKRSLLHTGLTVLWCHALAIYFSWSRGFCTAHTHSRAASIYPPPIKLAVHTIMIKCRARGAALLVYGGEHTLSSPNRLDLCCIKSTTAWLQHRKAKGQGNILCKLALACRFSNGESTLWLFVSVEMLKQPHVKYPLFRVWFLR